MHKLSPEGETLDAFMAAHRMAFVALVRCLEDNGALRTGQLADALHMSMETQMHEVADQTLAMVHTLRQAILE